MKTVILVLSILITSLSAFAQAKIDTVKRVKAIAEFKIDPNKPYELKLSLTYQQASIFLIKRADWREKVSRNKQLTSDVSAEMEDFDDEIKKELTKQLNALIQADYKRFADSVKKANILTVKK